MEDWVFSQLYGKLIIYQQFNLAIRHFDNLKHILPNHSISLTAALAEIYSDSVDDKHIVDFIFLELQVTVPPTIPVIYLPPSRALKIHKWISTEHYRFQ